MTAPTLGRGAGDSRLARHRLPSRTDMLGRHPVIRGSRSGHLVMQKHAIAGDCRRQTQSRPMLACQRLPWLCEMQQKPPGLQMTPGIPLARPNGDSQPFWLEVASAAM